MSLGLQMLLILAEHEGECDELIPHSFVDGFVRQVAETQPLDRSLLDLLLKMVMGMQESADPDVVDLLYASAFPQMEEYPHLLADFLAAANPSVVDFYRDWAAMP